MVQLTLLEAFESGRLDKVELFREHVIELSKNESFIHHEWFVDYHLKIVEQIATELCEKYPDADKTLIKILVWLHDYGKIINFPNQYETTLTRGSAKLLELGFEKSFVEKTINYVKIMDSKQELDKAPLEVQIISSADGAAHLIGPFYFLWWYENPNKEFAQLMEDNKLKALKDWNKKIVLQEVREAFQKRHEHLLEKCGEFPKKFLV